MKRLFIICIILFSVSLSYGQYFDTPRVMVRDTLYTVNTRVTQDFYYNEENNFTRGAHYQGPVDLHIKTTMASSIAGSDTVTIEVYGILRKILYGGTTWSTTYTDSHRVVVLPVDSLIHVYPIDPLWTHFPIYDGLHYVYKKGGSDADSTNVDSNHRLWKQGEDR